MKQTKELNILPFFLFQLEKELLQLQETNKLYRETAANELLLKEKISALQESVQRYKEQCQAIPDLQVIGLIKLLFGSLIMDVCITGRD